MQTPLSTPASSLSSSQRHAIGRTVLAFLLACSLLATLAGVGAATARAEGRGRREAAAPASASQGYADGTLPYFVHTASAANSAGDYTWLDNPYTNFEPNAILMVTQIWNNTTGNGATGIYNNHNIGVWYDGWEWTIFNEDGAPIPTGANFAVNVAPQAAGNLAFVQQATAGNTVGDSTFLSNPNTDGQPNALLIVTPVFGSTSLYENHPIGVWYDGSHWAIFNQDQTPMQSGELFDVAIWPAIAAGPNGGPPNAVGSTVTASPTFYDSGQIGDAYGMCLEWITPNWEPSGVFNNHPTGVWWTVDNNLIATCYAFNEDYANMPAGMTFNVELLSY